MVANEPEDIIDVEMWEKRRKVDECYGKIGENHCREWDYLCARRG